MRKFILVAITLAAACEIEPPPKKQPAPVVTETTGQAAVAAPPAPKLEVQQGSGSAAPKIEVTQECVTVGSHVAEVFIAAATDPAQKSVYEQERTRMVRVTAEACTIQQWPDAARSCYLGAKTPAAIKKCEQQFPPTPMPPQPTPAGAQPTPGGAQPGAQPAPGGAPPSGPVKAEPTAPVRVPAGPPTAPQK